MTDADPARYERLRAAFHAVAEQPSADPADAAARAFPDDPDLQRDLLDLLAEVDRDDSPGTAPHFDMHAHDVREHLVSHFEQAIDAPDHAATHLRGKVIGPFTIEAFIGAGSGSTVYRAIHQDGRTRVALKLLNTTATVSGDTAHARFDREARILSQLSHAGIARFIAAGVNSIDDLPRPWLATEFIEGVDILRSARDRNLGITQRLELMGYICTAVHYAHEAGCVHRDLKPSNILVTPGGQPVVLDFGIAQMTAAEMRQPGRTRPGELIGTLAYMSPEQAATDRPDTIDARSDVYALGVIAYRLLTGRLPYELAGRSVPEQLRIIRETPPTPPGRINPQLAGAIEAILGTALRKDPAERYPSARALAADIRRHLRGEAIDATHIHDAPAAHDRAHARPVTARAHRRMAYAAMLLLGIAIGITGWLVGEHNADRARDNATAAVDEAHAQAERSRAAAEHAAARAMQLADILYLEAEAHMAAGRFNEAAILYRTVLEAIEELHGSEDPRVIEIRQRLEAVTQHRE